MTRNINELLILLLCNLHRVKNSCGLCGVTFDLWINNFISDHEKETLKTYIAQHPPLLKPWKNGKAEFYWPAYAIPPRRKWLIYHIYKTQRTLRKGQ